MPGFIGGSGGSSSGTGGEILFPKEFIDPVTKLRVSQPENLIDTDFEYGLQPTKWETVELINNTPSFFSKGGDTTIPGIISVITNAGTREITVTTALEHGLAVGIPISVTGTKSITADGAYIINSIPNSVTFTYLCRDNQVGNNSIEDLYTSIITGEFFQGSQLRVSDSDGILTDGADISTLTVKTESTHGFGENTPFYFLNLNSTISQEFEAANTAAKSFDSSNSATAQTFDGSNTLSTFNIDWSNSATIAGATSAITNVNVDTDTFTVTHTTENFAGSLLGTPLYYSVSASTGYFNTNPRGVVFLKTVAGLGVSTSSFQVSETPDGEAIDLTSAMTGTFQLANQARTFAGNNRNPATETAIQVVREEPIAFDGGNRGYAGAEGSITQTNGLSTVLGFTGDSILVSTTAGAGLDYYEGAMIQYSTTGSAATGLTNNETYFVSSISSSGSNLYTISVKSLPTSATVIAASGGTGTQTFNKIGVSITRDIIHARDSSFAVGDMLEYEFPVDGRFTAAGTGNKLFYVVQTAYDAHNYLVNDTPFIPITATGGTTTEVADLGRTWRVHTFTSTGGSSFAVEDAGSESTVQYLIVGGGGAGGNGMGGGGGAGGLIENLVTGTPLAITNITYPIVVGAGGVGTTANTRVNGGNSTAFGLTAIGGGGANSLRQQREAGINTGNAGGSGGGAGGLDSAGTGGAAQQAASPSGGFGNAGGNFPHVQNNYPGAGGGAAGEAGQAPQFADGDGGRGGNGRRVNIDGNNFYYAGGGGGNTYVNCAGGQGGLGGGGGGSTRSDGSPGSRGGLGGFFARNTGETGLRLTEGRGGNAGANTGGGGGGAAWNFGAGGNGGSGIVIVRYPITPPPDFVAAAATGGALSTRTIDGVQYRIHAFTAVGSSNFVVQSVGSWNKFEYLIVGGGGGGGGWGGGGGGGGVLSAITGLSAQTYSIVVGGGGARGTNVYTGGTNGGVSSAFGVTALGGGGGGWYNGNNGRNGASGGGAGLTEGTGGFAAGGTGTAGQGYSGGAGGNNANGAWTVNRAGGGGGAGGPGNNGAGTFSDSGRGGIGLDFSREFGTAFGQAGWFGGGGGGHSGQLGTLSIGGRGGGGRGGRHAGGSGVAALSGTANTGGGGGGAWGGGGEAIGDGGSGIVLIRYAIGLV
jgi:hypothetical protein